MSSLYPGALDDFENPVGTDDLENIDNNLDHATQHSNENDAIEALEAKVGVGASTPSTAGYLLTSTGAGSSAWEPTSASTIKPFVTVGFSDADYICDGVADDVQINAASLSIFSTGGTVFIKAGTYGIAATLNTYTGVSFVGESFGSVLLVKATGTTGGNADIFRTVIATNATYQDNVTLENLVLDGTSQGASGNLITLQGVNGLTLRNIKLINPASFGIDIGSSGGGTPYVERVSVDRLFYTCAGGSSISDGLGGGGIKNSAFRNIYVYKNNRGGSGIDFTNMNSVKFSDIDIEFASPVATNWGISSDFGSQNVKLQRVRVYNAGQYGFYFGSTTNGLINDLKIDDCTADTAQINGVWVQGTVGFPAADVNVTNSTVRAWANGNAAQGVKADYVNGIKVLGNTFANPLTASQNPARFVNCTDVKATNNYIIGTNQPMIQTSTTNYDFSNNNYTTYPGSGEAFNVVSGNIGVNKTNPATILDIVGNTNIRTIDTSNLVPLTILQDDVTNNGKALSVTNTGTGNAVYVKPNGNTGTNTTSSGALMIDNSSNTGIGLSIFTNNSGTAAAPVVSLNSSNSGFNQKTLSIAHVGTADYAQYITAGKYALGIDVDSGATTTGAGVVEIATNQNLSAIKITDNGVGTPATLDVAKAGSNGASITGIKLSVANASSGGAIALNVTSPTATSGTVTGVKIAAPSGGSANYALNLSDTGGTAAGGITFGTDVQLYRSGSLALSITDGTNLVVGASTGTKIGTATSQKIGFYNSTPIVQPSGDVVTALTNLGLVATPTVTATTNANLTGPITSSGNATSIASQTGTGTKFVMSVSPTMTGTTTTGNLTLGTAGNKISITTGSNASAGTGTLTGGTVTISTTAVTANSLIFLTDTASSITNVGTLTVSAKTAGTSFVVTSTLALDTSTFNWLIIN